MYIFFLGILIFLLSGIVSNLFIDKYKIPVLTMLNGIGATLCISPAINVLLNSSNISKNFELSNIFGQVCFKIDLLGAFFITVICVMAFLSLIYANGYLKPYIEKGKSISAHIVFLPVLIASMLLVVTCHNALMFLVCWEIMSLSSFFLVIFENEDKKVRQAGIKYLVFMHISVLFIIITFAFLSIKSGSYDFETFKKVLENNPKFSDLIFILGFIGFGTKAGFVPFHNWLPTAHPEAPSHVSAIMSGVMIKTGIYGIIRIISLIGTPSKFISFFVLIISVISALYGVLYAITQHDIKKLLAYHSIENIGIIGIGIGSGMLGLAYNNIALTIFGFSGAILHILNHSIFKELLFLTAGCVYLKTHTKNIELLGGLIKSMPYTAVLFLIGSVAICGLPPLNGFVSEILIYAGMIEGLSIKGFGAVTIMILSIGALALVGTMAVLCFTKAFSIIFLGLSRSEKAENVKNDCDFSMVFPMSLLALFTLLIGIFPQFVYTVINAIVRSLFLSDKLYLQTNIGYGLINIVSILALVFCIAMLGLILIRTVILKRKITVHSTWGCGYNKANNYMQYTASSYASPFLSMLKPLFKKNFDIEKPNLLFPKTAHFSLHIEDIEEAYIINPLIKNDEKFLSKFETLQSGNIQSYIKFGLIFLAIVVIVSLFMG